MVTDKQRALVTPLTTGFKTIKFVADVHGEVQNLKKEKLNKSSGLKIIGLQSPKMFKKLVSRNVTSRYGKLIFFNICQNLYQKLTLKISNQYLKH